MRILSIFVAAGTFLLLLTTGTQLTSCTKEVTIRDTVTIKDTVTVKDTVIIIDSSCASCYDLSAGLVAYYNFNGGTLNDSSGYNNHVVFSNATKTADKFGNADNAYKFNGSSSYMRTPHHSSLNLGLNITLSARVKFDGFYIGSCHGNNIFSKGDNDYKPGIYLLRASYFAGEEGCNKPTDITKEMFHGGIEGAHPGVFTDTFLVKTDQWYDVTYTYDGQYSLIYVNGQLKKKVAVAIPTPSSNSNDLFIGKQESIGFPYWFNGVIDDIRIYKRTLCEAEVRLLHNLKK
jgi:hypothetical protein